MFLHNVEQTAVKIQSLNRIEDKSNAQRKSVAIIVPAKVGLDASTPKTVERNLILCHLIFK